MSAGNTTSAQITSAGQNFLSLPLLSRAYPHFVFPLWGQVRDIPRNKTENVRFRKYASLSAATTALTEGVTPAGSQASITDITATVLQYGDYITLTDYLDMTTIDPYKTELAEVLGDEMGDTLDQLTKAVLIAGTTIQYVQGVVGRTSVAAGMILTGDEIRKAVRTLQGNNAKPITEMIDPTDGFNTSPIMPCYVGIISEKTHFDLKKDPDWVKVAEYADPSERIHEAEVGSLDEVRFILAAASTSGSGTANGSGAAIALAGGSGGIDVHLTMIFGKEAYGLTRIAGNAVEVITKELGTGGTVDPLNQRATMGWKAIYVVKRLQENFMLRLEHAVSS